MQTNLEKYGIEARNDSFVKNDYDKGDVYSEIHVDAISTGKALGKGTMNGSHTHSTPGLTSDKSVSRSNFDTYNGGGKYDIEGYNGVGGRNFLQNISKYNSEFEYGPNLIDTKGNDGQIRISL